MRKILEIWHHFDITMVSEQWSYDNDIHREEALCIFKFKSILLLITS